MNQVHNFHIIPAGLMKLMCGNVFEHPDLVRSLTNYWSRHYEGVFTIEDVVHYQIWEQFQFKMCVTNRFAVMNENVICLACNEEVHGEITISHRSEQLLCARCRSNIQSNVSPAFECETCIFLHWEEKRHLMSDANAMRVMPISPLNGPHQLSRFRIVPNTAVLVDAYTTTRHSQHNQSMANTWASLRAGLNDDRRPAYTLERALTDLAEYENTSLPHNRTETPRRTFRETITPERYSSSPIDLTSSSPSTSSNEIRSPELYSPSRPTESDVDSPLSPSPTTYIETEL